VFPSRSGRRRGRKLRGVTIAGVAIGVVLATTASAVAASVTGIFGTTQVGSSTDRGILLPDNQYVKPAGDRFLITNGRFLASTLNPAGTQLAALTYEHGTGYLSIMDVQTGAVVQQVGTGAKGDPKFGDGTTSTDPPLYSPDGRTLWSQQGSDIVRWTVGGDGKVSAPVVTKLTGPHGDGLPGGLALSADGSKLYVALNGNNTLGVIDTATNALTAEIPVGNAPRQVVLVGDKAYVSNEGGRTATAQDFTNLSDGTDIVSNPVTGGVSTGTVSIVDLSRGAQVGTLKVGLEPTAEYLHGSTLFVANSADDSVSVIDTRLGRVTQTVNVNPIPGRPLGSYPNAITMPDAHHVLVSIGRDNAIAEFSYASSLTPLRYTGLIPTDWYPTGVQLSKATGKIVVTNDKGIGSRGPETSIGEGPSTGPGASTVTGHNTYNDTASLTTWSMPTQAQLARDTHQVFVNNDWEKLLAQGANARGNAHAAPVAIPARLGAPSKIKHVFLIVKENRTYDQVLGDIGKGDSDPTLAQFGANITPNLHDLANQNVLFDNFYDEGTLSADGHNWLVQADANDYLEKEYSTWYRSYGGNDALLYQKSGFLWDSARRAGRTVQDFGEYGNVQLPTPPPTWADWYKSSQILEGKQSGPLPIQTGQYPTVTDVPSLSKVMYPAYPAFDTDIPDQYRVDIWQQAFAQAEKTNSLANLNILWVPDDHTNGTSGNDPYPTAMAADNDLAVGRIVDTISHSKDWKDSAVFVVEDDSQAGTDHVDGHRAPLWIASPYAKKGAVDSTYYSQINVIRTIEQILGMQPMNQMDRGAEPMTDAFTNTPDYAPYTAAPNNVPLTFGLKGATSAGQPSVPAAERATYELWVAWSDRQLTGGAKPQADVTNPAQLNRLDWYAATGWTRPYPGDTRILAPNDVPGADLPSSELGN
jgi:YVTN family beta-propeller protein